MKSASTFPLPCAALLAAALASGCALLGPPRPHAPPPLLPPSAVGAARAASQSIDIAYADRDLNLQCALSVQDDVLTLIAIGPLGRRALTLHYDGKTIDARSDGEVPKEFPPAQILADVELVLWPIDAWQHRLQGTDWDLAEPRPGLRRLRWRDRLVAEVHYPVADGDPWSGQAWLSNLAYGYTLDIRTQRQ